MKKLENIQTVKQVINTYCDKCGKEIMFYYYPHKLIKTVKYGIIYKNEKEYDICNTCIDEILKSFKGVESEKKI